MTLFGSLFVTKVHALIFINEVSPASNPEWIELYNDGDQAVDLEGWELTDGQIGSYHFGVTILSPNNSIAAYNYLVIYGETDSSTPDLKNDGETIFLYDASDEEVNSLMTYPNIASNKSYSRSPNGSNTWVITTQTPNAANPGPTPLPTPTPTSSPTSTPTPVPTPTPTRTPTPTKAQSPSPNPTPTPKPIAVPTDSDEDSPLETGSEPLVLGSTQEEPSPSVDSPDSAPPSRSFPYLPVIALVLGSLLLLTSAFFLANKYLLKAKE